MPKRGRSSEPKNFEQLVRHKTHRFFRLHDIADRLNDLPRYRVEALSADDPDERKWKSGLADGWGVIEEILSLKSLKEQAERFTEEARAHPVYQRVLMENVTINKSTSLQPVPSCALPTSWRAHALDRLWRDYFHDQAWERFRRCGVCRTWFVDATDNKNKAYCSPKCRDRWWTRERRQQEHKDQKQRLEEEHKHLKVGGKLHGTEKRKG